MPLQRNQRNGSAARFHLNVGQEVLVLRLNDPTSPNPTQTYFLPTKKTGSGGCMENRRYFIFASRQTLKFPDLLVMSNIFRDEIHSFGFDGELVRNPHILHSQIHVSDGQSHIFPSFQSQYFIEIHHVRVAEVVLSQVIIHSFPWISSMKPASCWGIGFPTRTTVPTRP